MQYSSGKASFIQASALCNHLLKNAGEYGKMVPFDPLADKLVRLHFTAGEPGLNETVINDTDQFSNYIINKIGSGRYGIGGYDELRTVYARSAVFSDAEEPRRLHLGIDIWGPAGTPVFAPLDGTIHSIAFNDQYGDYGATIILKHQLEEVIFHTLYGHLALADLDGLREGQIISKGLEFAHFGPPSENGHWPPHLHFQVIDQMEDKKGDYPGVCKLSEREKYLGNCPDADLVLQMMRYV